MLSMLRRRCVGVVSSSIITIPNNSNKLFPRRSFLDIPSPPPSTCYYKWEKETIAHIYSASRDFDDMLSQRYSTISDYNNLFSSLLKIHQYTTVLRLAKRLEQESQNPYRFFPVKPDIDTWLILVTCHVENGDISSAFSLFRKIINAGHRPNSSILNDLFRCLLVKGHIYKAMLFYNYIFLKGGFQVKLGTYHCLVNELCKIGETKSAIHLLRQVQKDKIFCNDHELLYIRIIVRLCKDRLVHQAYDLYSEMSVKNIFRSCTIYHYLVYGYCIIGQFKQAIALFRELEPPHYLPRCSYFNVALAPTLVTDAEVKDAKTVVAVMVKCGVKPNMASYHSVFDELYKGRRVNKIAKMVETLLVKKPSIAKPCFSGAI